MRYSIKQASSLTGVAPSRIVRYMREGRIPVVQRGDWQQLGEDGIEALRQQVWQRPAVQPPLRQLRPEFTPANHYRIADIAVHIGVTENEINRAIAKCQVQTIRDTMHGRRVFVHADEVARMIASGVFARSGYARIARQAERHREKPVKYTLGRIARAIGISREYVRQLRNRGLIDLDISDEALAEIATQYQSGNAPWRKERIPTLNANANHVCAKVVRC